jgi:nitric oxide dioxygenase
MLSQKTIDTVKSTAPVLREHGVALTTHFYDRMFRTNPEVAPFFNPANQAAGKQPRALAGAVAAYAEHIDNLPALTAAVELIAQKHAALMVKAEHYPIVGENLLASISEVLGEAATPEIMEAWAEAYALLADILIGREAQIYETAAGQPGGWEGFKTFRVARKEAESENVTSFYLVPEDGGSVPLFEAGQYVTVRVPSAITGTQMRNYSLSCAPGEEALRISVKKEPAARGEVPPGLVSSFLHEEVEEGDTVDLGPPCGEFTLGQEADTDRPLVFLAGGIGVTPLISMAKAALDARPGREVLFLHLCRNEGVQPLRSELQALSEAHPSMVLHTRYSDLTERRDEGCSTGLLDDALLDTLLPEGEPIFYFCGPEPFMKLTHSLLARRGVPEERIAYEFFGPLQALETLQEAA